MSDRLTVAEIAKRLAEWPDRRPIFTHQNSVGDKLLIVRESDGSVTVTIGTFGSAASIGVTAAQCRKLVASFAIESGLWPGDCDCDIKAAQAEVGKPHGGPVQ